MIDVKKMTVTPEMAQKWLESNYDKQRPLNKKSVNRYANIMREGRWMVNCDAVGFDTEGRVINGQHRLHAIIASGVEVEMLVVTGLDSNVFEVQDNGAGRTAGQVLAVEGVKHYNATAAVVRRLIITTKAGKFGTATFTGGQPFPVEHYMVREVANTYPSLIETMDFVINSKVGKVTNVTMVGLLHFLYCHLYGNEVATFVERLANGVGLTQNDPIYHLRERLVRSKASKTPLRREEEFALLVLALNAHCKRRTLKVLKWSPGANQPYPQPIIPLPGILIPIQSEAA